MVTTGKSELDALLFVSPVPDDSVVSPVPDDPVVSPITDDPAEFEASELPPSLPPPPPLHAVKSITRRVKLANKKKLWIIFIFCIH